MTIGFYVTVKDGSRTGFLLGPYDTHDEALANVERGKTLAMNTDNAARTWFYAYGTSKLTTGKPVLPNGVFGK